MTKHNRGCFLVEVFCFILFYFFNQPSKWNSSWRVELYAAVLICCSTCQPDNLPCVTASLWAWLLSSTHAYCTIKFQVDLTSSKEHSPVKGNYFLVTVFFWHKCESIEQISPGHKTVYNPPDEIVFIIWKWGTVIPNYLTPWFEPGSLHFTHYSFF